MPDLSAKAMIDYLVTDRFPTPKVPIGRVFAAGGGLVSAADQMANAAELRGELEKLDGESLRARYETRVTAKANLARAVAEAAEAAHPFNQPHARAVFDHWGKLTYWKVDEGLALLLGRSPSSLVWENVKHIPSPVVWQFATMREVAQRAVHWKQLHDPSYPGSFIIWAKRMQFPVPTELEEKAAAYGQYIGDWNTLYDDLKLKYDELINERAANSAQAVTALNDLGEKWTKQYRELSEASSANLARATAGLAERNATIKALVDELGKLKQQLAAVPAERPLGQREADSLRTLIIGMATGGYGYDPTAIRSDVVKDIVDDLLKVGLNLGGDTVRKHLKQSAELLPQPDAPERKRDR
jgi:hypothetical protein